MKSYETKLCKLWYAMLMLWYQKCWCCIYIIVLYCSVILYILCAIGRSVRCREDVIGVYLLLRPNHFYICYRIFNFIINQKYRNLSKKGNNWKILTDRVISHVKTLRRKLMGWIPIVFFFWQATFLQQIATEAERLSVIRTDCSDYGNYHWCREMMFWSKNCSTTLAYHLRLLNPSCKFYAVD